MFIINFGQWLDSNWGPWCFANLATTSEQVNKNDQQSLIRDLALNAFCKVVGTYQPDAAFYDDQCDQIGWLLDFRQLFNVFANNLFAQIFHILRQFL